MLFYSFGNYVFCDEDHQYRLYTERGGGRKLWGLLLLMVLKTMKEYLEEFHQLKIFFLYSSKAPQLEL